MYFGHMSSFFMIFIYKIHFCIKESQTGIKIGYFSTINRNIVKQANIMLMNTYPRFLPFLLYSRCKLGSLLHGMFP